MGARGEHHGLALGKARPRRPKRLHGGRKRMQLGINWVAVAVFAVAFVVSQIRSIPVRVRYFTLAGANAIVGLILLRAGGHKFNLAIGVLALAMAVHYGLRALRSHSR